jgi:hypothetical protein
LQRFATPGVDRLERIDTERELVQFAVVRRGMEWTVLRDGEQVAEGMSRSQAIELADRLAFEKEEQEDVEVLVQDYTGEVQARYSGPGA